MLTSKKILIRQNKPLARLKNFDILHGVSYKKRPLQTCCLNWYCQLLPCFDGELNLVR